MIHILWNRATITKKAQDALIISLGQNEKGVLLYGDIGVGKTYLCQALANEYAKQGKTVGFMQMQELVERVKQEFDKPAEKGNILRLAQTCDVLFLDDLGAEMMTAYNRDAILMKILDTRALQKKKTYITTNLESIKLFTRKFCSTLCGSKLCRRCGFRFARCSIV